MAEKMLSVKEDGYSEDFKFKEQAFKNKLPAKLVEPFTKEVVETLTKSAETGKTELIEKLKEGSEDLRNEASFETRLNAGVKALGITFETFKKVFPLEVRYNKVFLKAITDLGKAQYTKDGQLVLDEKNPDVPN